ncbi:signal recognition particle subunit FFH/SRP54 (srp54) [Hydrogenoanaerobacterium saccharovorans]|uniref:Signal recognition particle protein n=1 Tax=Hydrogenoanaerobacterium saccharovorans TaxID=474960 RepID=A0A1H8AEF9_9FIRM|nr:signal recognition particle protein [Hydrogenoanaerobacterium saccharovorans]RPF47988.1 signal recognition particle subunit FFH/SRP54 (srp54) [Hydrogenoanaerobacterium saccharovorans]SEM69155.1 signal recognition particle subunit FFH/SRP54 (srp54) [Hydrogenoanaerobacterium saccharovorans]
MAFEGLSDKLSAAFKKLRSKGKLSEADVKEAMREVRLALLEADVNYKVAKDFVKSVTERAIGSDVLTSLTPAQQVIKIVNDELTTLMGAENSRINFSSKIPTIIMMCGLQGSGKTTHSAKLAKFFKKQGKRPLLVACDVYRPAAIDQLKVVGEKVGAPVFEMGQIDPVTIAKKAISHAKDYGHDIVILDTAGRLHIDEQLMGELKNIKSELKPNEILLVIDSMTGQDAVNVAKSFDEALGIDGVILTKLDGDTRGGAALSVRAVTGKPIKFVGMGEKLEDLEPFYPDRMASRILGMGDVLTLIDKAQEQLDLGKSEKMAQKLKENSFDLDDLLEQMKQIRKMGPLSQVLSMLPGVKGAIKDEEAEQGEAQLRQIETIINSMTKAERAKPAIVNPSRKRRIAAGSGTKVEDVNRLLRQFEQMQKMMKQFSGMGKKGKRMRGMMSGMGGGSPFGL